MYLRVQNTLKKQSLPQSKTSMRCDAITFYLNYRFENILNYLLHIIILHGSH